MSFSQEAEEESNLYLMTWESVMLTPHVWR